MLEGKINIKKLDDRAIVPTYGSEFSAGADLYAVLDDEIVIKPGETVLVRTGIAMEIPIGYAGFIISLLQIELYLMVRELHSLLLLRFIRLLLRKFQLLAKQLEVRGDLVLLEITKTLI